jgi:methionyl-tRNA formyltransferase
MFYQKPPSYYLTHVIPKFTKTSQKPPILTGNTTFAPMIRHKILFLGNKDIGYECLLHLIQHQQELNIDIIGVLSQNKGSITGKASNLMALAQEHQIPALESLNELPEADFIISVQYHLILQKKHIQKAKKQAINLHMAPLPDYRGCNQFSFAILDEAKEFGTTLHVLDEGIDSGDILFEDRFPIPAQIRVKDLYDLTYQKSVDLFKRRISRLLEGKYTPIPQKNLLSQRKTHFHLRREMDDIKQIDLNWPRQKIEKYVRASYFPPFSPPYAIVDGKKIDITPDWLKNNPSFFDVKI